MVTENVKKPKSLIHLFIRDKPVTIVGRTQRNFSRGREEEDNTQVEMPKKEV